MFNRLLDQPGSHLANEAGLAYFSPAKTLIMRSLMMALTLLTTLVAGAQKYEDKMDHNFKPATLNARYYVVTEKTDSGWHRKAWYLPELGMAMDGRFADKECGLFRRRGYGHGTIARGARAAAGRAGAHRCHQ